MFVVIKIIKRELESNIIISALLNYAIYFSIAKINENEILHDKYITLATVKQFFLSNFIFKSF